MVRATSILVALCLVLAINMQSTDALASIVRRAQDNRFGWGIVGRQNDASSRVSRISTPMVVEASSRPNVRSDDSITPTTPIVVSVEAFDGDSYRREITNLVYQRNIQRLNDY